MEKKILLKLSGESLSGNKCYGIDKEKVLEIAKEIKECIDLGFSISIVVGGGNFWRGKDNSFITKPTTDYIGMLATVMNAIALQSALRKLNVSCRVQSAIDMDKIAEPYIRFKAIRHLEKNRVVIFAAGTGNPFFTTDTAAALRASEIDAQVMLMAKNGVDGVYSDDPRVNKNAKKYDKITYDDIIVKGLKVMDTASCALCKQNHIPIIVFDFAAKGSIARLLSGETLGTFVGE